MKETQDILPRRQRVFVLETLHLDQERRPDPRQRGAILSANLGLRTLEALTVQRDEYAHDLAAEGRVTKQFQVPHTPLGLSLKDDDWKYPGPAGGPVEAALVSWALSQALGLVLQQAPRARTKALLRLLIGEIRVVSPADIRPTTGCQPRFAHWRGW